MTAFNLLHPNHIMDGLDIHDVQVKGTKFLFPHYVTAPMRGSTQELGSFASTVKHTPKVWVYFAEALQRSTDIGMGIPHAPPQPLVVWIMLSSSSKAEFGAGTVRVQGRPVGVALLITANLNLNCADPFRAPTGYVRAPHTVRAGMTEGDLFAGFAEMAFDIGWARMKKDAFSDLKPGISRILGRSIAAFLKGRPDLAAQVEKAFSFGFSKAADSGKWDSEFFDRLPDVYDDPKHRVFL
jgi:hypothetical protein